MADDCLAVSIGQEEYIFHSCCFFCKIFLHCHISILLISYSRLVHLGYESTELNKIMTCFWSCLIQPFLQRLTLRSVNWTWSMVLESTICSQAEIGLSVASYPTTMFCICLLFIVSILSIGRFPSMIPPHCVEAEFVISGPVARSVLRLFFYDWWTTRIMSQA